MATGVAIAIGHGHAFFAHTRITLQGLFYWQHSNAVDAVSRFSALVSL